MAKRSRLVDSGTVRVGAAEIPFEVRAEARRDTRFSLTARKAFLRVPARIAHAELARAREQFAAWLTEAVARRGDLRDLHTAAPVSAGQVWQLGPYRYRIAELRAADGQGASAKTLREDRASGTVELSLKLPPGLSDRERGEATERLLFRLVGRRATPRVQALLQQVNAAHFGVEVGRLKLSPTRTRWGSCSSSGTISLSTRLLAAPARTLHAVLVHELAHRLEMNHSPRFWRLVRDAMPDYDAAHAWLREHGASLGWRRDGDDPVA